MDGVSKATVDRALKLLEVAREHMEKAELARLEAAELLGGGTGTAATMRLFVKVFDRLWCQRYAHGQTGRYIWRWAVDTPNIKRLLRTLGLPELEVRAARYLQTSDPFLDRQRHPFGLFVSGINSYAGAADAPAGAFELDGAPVPDCKHTPPCQSDQEHTQRKRAERMQ